MNGIISTSGQYWLLSAIQTKIEGNGGVYVGLATNTVVPTRSYQTPSGLTELSSTTCSGYSRKLCSNWVVVSGTDPHLFGSEVTFTVASGSWANVYSYFVSYNNTNSGVLWSELLPPDKAGVIASGNPIRLSPRYYQY
jgi:hypothetical protein